MYYHRIDKEYIYDYKNNIIYFNIVNFAKQYDYINDNNLKVICLKLTDDGHVCEEDVNGWNLCERSSFGILYIVNRVFIKFPTEREKAKFKIKFD